jgi:hypothetical protein
LKAAPLSAFILQSVLVIQSVFVVQSGLIVQSVFVIQSVLQVRPARRRMSAEDAPAASLTATAAEMDNAGRVQYNSRHGRRGSY